MLSDFALIHHAVVATTHGQLLLWRSQVSLFITARLHLMVCIVLLSTGKRRYGHPALNGVLPQPWLPLKKGQTLANFVDHDESEQNGDRGARKYGPSNQEAVVLTLRRRYSVMRKDVRNLAGKLIGGKSSDVARGGTQAPEGTGVVAESTGDEDGEPGTVPRPPSNASSNPWKDAGPGPSRSATDKDSRLPPSQAEQAHCIENRHSVWDGLPLPG